MAGAPRLLHIAAMTPVWRALDELMALAGRTRPADLSIDEGATALDTRFFAEEACAAVLAACGALVTEIGEPQAVSVSTREAAAALVSFLQNRFEDPEMAPVLAREEHTPANGFFRTRDDRFVYLHQSFPDSAARLHALMGSPVDKAAAVRSAFTWDAQDLEDAIAERGLCGAVARTPEEWDASEQGRVLAASPVVEVVRIGDSDPEPFAASTCNGNASPLAGMRTLDLTRVLAGPTCAKALAALGAEVLYLASPSLPTIEMFVADTNPGKRSAFLDLKTPAGRECLEGLVGRADVFSQGYRGGALERLGFGPARLAQFRPGIVCVEIDCYGHDGPWRARPGWEQLAQTVTGMAVLHGEHQGADGPMLQPAAVNDYTTGYLAAFGAMIALTRRARFGGSWLVRASLSRTAMWVRSLGLAERSIEPLSEAEVEGWRVAEASGYGPMRRLRAPIGLARTPARWQLPVAKLGAHPPIWT